MPSIVGTTGNDSLVGTALDDFINARTGFDTVDGGAGRDRLTVNYSVFTAYSARFPSIVVLDAAGLSGTIESRVSNDYVTFSGIEVLDVTFGMAAEWLIVRADTPFAGERLVVDAGAGQDRLSLDLVPVGNVRLQVATDGTVTTNMLSRFAGFEEYYLTLGDGFHSIVTGAFDDRVTIGAGISTIATGAGEDVIVSNGGRGTFDAGAAYDRITFQLENIARAASLSYNGASGAGLISGGTTMAGVEELVASLGARADTVRLTNAIANVSGGAGADAFTITRPVSVTLDGGDGIDTAAIDLSQGSAAIDDALRSSGAGGFDGSLYRDVTFTSIERLTITLGNQADFLVLDAAPLAQGATLTLDGGLAEGSSVDILQLDFSSLASATALVAADGSLAFGGGVISGFETIRITGTAGNDHFEGASSVDGGAGDDVLQGTAGQDTLRGGDGNDTLHAYGAGGHDDLNGGAGDDRYYMDAAGQWPAIHEAAGEGSDALFSSVSAALWDNVETLWLTGSDDISGSGTEANDALNGNGGGNQLMGNGGDDTLSGGEGIDQLFGGAGADTLTGGAGFDLFWFDTLEPAQHDTITDFAPEDALYFERSAFTGLAAFPFNSYLPTSAFATGSEATTSDHRIVYDDLTGALYYDADGIGGTSQILVATLTNIPGLTASDILVF